jgi:predicted metal-binding membrane protein
MPLEGHFQRVNTPLRRLTKRERNVVIAGLVVTLASLLALILATASDSRPQPAPGCIYTVVAGRTGGEPVHGCGAEAEAICAHSARFHNPRSETVVEACREAGVPTTGKPGGPFSVR